MRSLMLLIESPAKYPYRAEWRDSIDLKRVYYTIPGLGMNIFNDCLDRPRSGVMISFRL